MVLYKRKTISLPPAKALPSNIDRKIWYIKETGEWFLTYREFLDRLDFYTRHSFTCEITGTSCLTFFEALTSEESQFQHVERMFPLKLREPVAKFIHFNDIRRLDVLVEHIYSKFKNDFFPGEVVYLRKSKNELTAMADETAQNFQSQKVYIIKEKAQFNAVIDKVTQKELIPAHSKYMLQEPGGSSSIIADQTQIYRERSSFTKYLIKCFCKITLRRASTKMGAPWCVKDEYLPIYNLSPEWPDHMLKYKEDYIDPQQLLEMKEKERLKHQYENSRLDTPDLKRAKTDESISESSPSVDNTQNQTNSDPTEVGYNTITEITEDLNIPFMAPRPRKLNERFQFYSQDYVAAPIELIDRCGKGLTKLLNCYQFLMTFSETLQLSKFTWDNFVNSLRFSDPRQMMDEYVTVHFEDSANSKIDRFNIWNEDVYKYIESLNSDKLKITVELDVEINDEYLDELKITGTSLLVECFCVLLRLFVDANGNWTTLVADKWIESNESTGVDVNDQNSTHADIDTLLQKCLTYRKVEWTDRLAKRQFNNGFWLIILLGILKDCMHLPMYTESIQSFIKQLVPNDIEHSNVALNKQLWRRFCKNVSFYDKINVMWILVEVLSNFSSIIRSAMDDSMEVCNQIRSERFRLNKEIKNSSTQVSEYKSLLTSINSESETAEDQQKDLNEKLKESEAILNKYQRRKNFLDTKLMEADAQRLKPIGYDRYGNKIYWIEYSGVPRVNSSLDSPFLSNRLWFQGPSEEAALFYLKISKSELDEWLLAADEYGKIEATKRVFHVYRNESGSYYHHDENGDILLVNEQGELNSIISLSPIQRKIIDETPERLLMTQDDWAFLQDSDQIDQLINWWDTWGKREHETAKQMQMLVDPVKESIEKYQKAVCQSKVEEQQHIIDEIASMEFTEEELNLDNLPNDDKDVEVDDELERIAEEIMLHDDSSKTRKVLSRLEQLEAHRDELLAKKKLLDEKDSETEGKISRTKKKSIHASRARKASLLKENLDKLLNLKREAERLAISKWTNDLAVSTWTNELFRCNGNPKSSKDPIPTTVSDTFGEILKQAASAEKEMI